MEGRNHPACGEPTRHRFLAFWLSPYWLQLSFAREVPYTTQHNLVMMENNEENQHLEASGETSSTPILFDDDTPRDAELVPKVLLIDRCRTRLLSAACLGMERCFPFAVTKWLTASTMAFELPGCE